MLLHQKVNNSRHVKKLVEKQNTNKCMRINNGTLEKHATRGMVLLAETLHSSEIPNGLTSSPKFLPELISALLLLQ